jgi:predicted nucleic acid-binding protein
MKVLLDTCIISDIYKEKRTEILQSALEPIGEENCFVSVITLGEINNGINLLDEGKKKKKLLLWIEQFEKQYSDRIIGINADIAKTWGEIAAKCKRKGKIISTSDGLIAASAICNGLHVMTENVKDFEPTGVMVINPYSGED